MGAPSPSVDKGKMYSIGGPRTTGILRKRANDKLESKWLGPYKVTHPFSLDIEGFTDWKMRGAYESELNEWCPLETMPKPSSW